MEKRLYQVNKADGTVAGFLLIDGDESTAIEASKQVYRLRKPVCCEVIERATDWREAIGLTEV